MQEPLRTGGRRSAAVLDRVVAVGADADAAWFPTDGLVHLDLHTDNILAGDDGTLTGIIDWEGACAGDPRFDLVRFAYDLDGHDQPVWDVVEATGIEPRVLRAYVAHHALRCTSWQIDHRTDDVLRQLDRAERVLDRVRGLGDRARVLGLAGRHLALPLFSPPVVLLEQLTPVRVFLRIGFDRAVPSLVLLLAMRLAVEGVAAVHRLPALLAQSIGFFRLGLEDPGGADPRTVDDLTHSLSRDAKLSSRLLQIVQLLIPSYHSVRIHFS